MPIVSQGNSVVLDVGAHDGLWIKSTGSAEVTVNQVYAGTPEVINVTTETVRVGFYGEPVTVSIRAVSGQAEYQGQQFSIQPLTAVQGGDLTDSSPLDVKLAVNGLASALIKQVFSGLVDLSQPIGVHIYGNSLANAGTWVMSFVGQFGGKFFITRNSGVGGFTSAQVLAKLQAEGFAPLTKVMVFIEGTNDASQGVSTATHVENMRAIADYALSQGVVPLMCVTPPIDGAASAQANLNALNDFFLANEIGIPFVNAFDRYVDPTDGTWLPSATSDGTHPNVQSYIGAGVDMYNTLNNRTPVLLIPRLNAGNGLQGSNVLQYTDSNADNLPDNWQVLGMTGQTYNALTDYTFPYRGKRASVTISQSSGTPQLYKVQSKSGKYSDGDEIMVTGVMSITAISNCYVSVFVRNNGSAAPANDIFLGRFQDVMADKYLSINFIAQANSTDLRLFIRVDGINAGTFSCTITYGCFDFYNVTTQYQG